jgi:hypothetical protein
LTFVKQPDYWGGILGLGGLVLIIYIVVFAKPPPKPIAPPPPPPPAKRPAVQFPDLKVSGLTLHGSNSSVVINGRVVHLGEWVEGVQVIGIDKQGVCVVLDGQTNQLGLMR